MNVFLIIMAHSSASWWASSVRWPRRCRDLPSAGWDSSWRASPRGSRPAPPLLIVTAAVAVVITVLDYVIPSVSTKRYGGSKYGIWGCNIGLLVSIFGLPFGPTGLLGMVFWPFVGALVGEYIKQQDFQPAFRAGVGAFIGFLTGTLLKVVYCIALLVVVIVAIV